MTVQRPALADRYAIHLPVDSGDAMHRFVGTDVGTGQSVIVAVTTGDWARFERGSVSVAHRHLAAVIDTIEGPETKSFPSEVELPPLATAVVAELLRGKSLAELLREGPLHPDRAVAWTIRLLQALALLHERQVPHGAISALAVIAQPKSRPIAPVLSRLLVPPFREYASPERLAGEGPSTSDDLWAVGVVLYEMVAAKRPFDAVRQQRGTQELGSSDVAFLEQFAHGAALGVILRRALSSHSRRFSSATEMLSYLETWERRVALPRTLPTRPGISKGAPSGGDARAWDPMADEAVFGIRRIEATLDAAEQMRQSMLARGASLLAEPRRPAKKVDSARAPSRAPMSSRAPKSTGGRSVGPKSKYRPISLGPELAAFAARSRPKSKVMLGIFGAMGVLLVGGALLAFSDDKTPVVIRPVNSAPAETPSVSPSHSARPKRSAKEETNQCIRSYFREGALRAELEFGYVCVDEDFVGVTRRLHVESLVQAVPGAANTGASATVVAGSSTAAAVASSHPGADGGVEGATPAPRASASPELVVRSAATELGWQLGWYELVATAIIRQSCCKEAAPIKLPESTGWCQQLQNVVRRIASDSSKVGDFSPGVRTFDEAITCLMAQGRHVVYPYKAVPTSAEKSALQKFLKHAAEVDAQRSSRR